MASTDCSVVNTASLPSLMTSCSEVLGSLLSRSKPDGRSASGLRVLRVLRFA